MASPHHFSNIHLSSSSASDSFPSCLTDRTVIVEFKDDPIADVFKSVGWSVSQPNNSIYILRIANHEYMTVRVFKYSTRQYPGIG